MTLNLPTKFILPVLIRNIPPSVLRYRVRQRIEEAPVIFLKYADRVEKRFVVYDEDNICFKPSEEIISVNTHKNITRKQVFVATTNPEVRIIEKKQHDTVLPLNDIVKPVITRKQESVINPGIRRG